MDEHVARSIDDSHTAFAEPCFESIATRNRLAEIWIL
jgi:hypothetical protein